MTSTEIAAWWGAVVASLVLAWDFYKWFATGAKLRIQIHPDLAIVGDPLQEDKNWIRVNVSNIGDRPTTLKSVGMEYYENVWKWLQRRPGKVVIFPNPNQNLPLPRKIDPGEDWDAMIPQERKDKGLDFLQMAQDGRLLIYVSRSDKVKTQKKRLVVRDREHT